MEESKVNDLGLRIKKYLENKKGTPPFEIFFKDYLFLIDSEIDSVIENDVSESLRVFFRENPRLENEIKEDTLELLSKIYLRENSDLNHLAKPIEDLKIIYDCIN